jgi:AraC family transcriptional regulator
VLAARRNVAAAFYFLFMTMNPAGRLPAVTARYRERIEAVASRIRENPGATPDFPRLARSLGLSFSHFRKVFHDVIGRAPHEFVLDCRIRRAATWLRQPERQVKEIAAAAGFSTSAQFSRMFRRRTGLTPQAARRASLPWSPKA